MNNNIILFTFGLFFLCLGVFLPLVQETFGAPVTNYDTTLIEEIGQNEVNEFTILTTISAMFFWVFGVPIWLNIILTMMRVTFYVIAWDKFRGIGS